ncbi:hypothetical protein [Psychroserpens sp. MEBiC05023]
MKVKLFVIYVFLITTLPSCKDSGIEKEKLSFNFENFQSILDEKYWELREFGNKSNILTLYFSNNRVIFDTPEKITQIIKIDQPNRVILNKHLDELFDFRSSYVKKPPTEQGKKVIGYFKIEGEKTYIEIKRNTKNRFILHRLIKKLEAEFTEKTKENIESTNYIRLDH